MILRRLSLVLTAMVALAGGAQAQALFSDGFEDGTTDTWGGNPGRGDLRLTQYAGNTSLRLTRDAYAAAIVDVAGYVDVRVTAAFAADDLEGSDACLLEYSLDGQSWIIAGQIGNGDDDAVTLHRVSGLVPDEGRGPQIGIRLRAGGNSDNDTCWADNVVVTGRIAPESLQSFLTPEDFQAAADVSTPLSTAAFAPSPQALPPSQRFEGRLSLSGDGANSHFSVWEDRLNIAAAPGLQVDQLPVFAFEFVQAGDRLLPVTRGLAGGDHPMWEFVLTPGTLWDEPGESGWTRAAIPFALIERNANCTHNGLLTFRYGEGGTVSRVVYQIGSETCAYFKYDAWGTMSAAYDAGPVTNAVDIVRAYEAEVAARLPQRPLAALADDHPGMDVSAFGHPDDVTPDYMTTFGVVMDGVHYTADCATRYGPYPYCNELVLPSYSFAKSLFAGLGLMRLEELYPGAMDALITDYVPECAAVDGWDGVTFEHALDMATGRYNSTASEADENEAFEARFFLVESHAEKIDLACSQYPHRTSPGTQWVYHTTDTYILGTAMQSYLQEQTGGTADLYDDLLVEPVWQALGLSPTLSTTRRTYDDVAQPFTGWGLVLQRSDLARLIQFMAVDTGAVGGRQLIDADELAAALQRDPSDRGLVGASDIYRYNNGFWAWDAQSYFGCDNVTWIPFMSGFGGNSTAFMPSGAAYYYFSDNNEFRFARAVRAFNHVQHFCTGADE